MAGYYLGSVEKVSNGEKCAKDALERDRLPQLSNALLEIGQRLGNLLQYTTMTYRLTLPSQQHYIT